MSALECSRCGKRLSRKTARVIDGKLLCSTCMFAPPKRDSDGTAIAALCEDIAVPQDCQARAESIAQTIGRNHP